MDKAQFRNSTFYHHALKRLFITVLTKLSLSSGIPADLEPATTDGSIIGRAAALFRRARTTEIGQAVSMVAESLIYDVGEVRRLLKLDREPNDSDIIRLLKSLNEQLLTARCDQLRQAKVRVALFVDELHFAYAEEAAIKDDATLVRDAILSLMAINDRMAHEKLPAAIYAGVRSEYLNHPVIARSEVTTKVQSVGEHLGYETVPANEQHPLFELARRRIEVGLVRKGVMRTKASTVAQSIVNRLFANGPKERFLRITWSKPRDMVRFLKAAQKYFPHETTLSDVAFSTVMHQIAIESWSEMKSALSSFLTAEGLNKLEGYIAQHASQSLEAESISDFATFETKVAQCISTASDQRERYLGHALQMLYMVGMFTTSRRKPGGEPIRHSFHRGQPSPDRSGRVALHYLVAKAFS